MQRLNRTAGSFAILLIAYWLYVLLAVPWIEPSVDWSRREGISESDRLGGGSLVDAQMEQIGGLFPPDAWERKNPKILETDRAKILLEQYRNLTDRCMEITKCTIVFPYEGAAVDEAQRLRQSIVLQAPGGAVLHFDRPLDINRLNGSRFERGRFRGPVVIRSDWKQPGADDDLWIATADVELTQQNVSTASPVEFRWGRHFGRGRGMTIKLQNAPPNPDAEQPAMNVLGVEWFEIEHVERLCLDVGEAAAARAGGSGPMPVEITCQGPFRFDVLKHVASFQDRVDVRKVNPQGPADQMACDRLSLHFKPRSEKPSSDRAIGKAKSGAKPPDPLALEPWRRAAEGNPVVVTAPSRKEHGGTVLARGEKLEYDLTADAIELKGGREVFLQQGPNVIHAQSLLYRAADGAGLGRLFAQGPGRLQGQSPDRPDQRLEVVWQGVVRIDPQDGLHVVSILDGGALQCPGIGSLQASEIYFWMAETPAAPGGASRLRPVKMLARPGKPVAPNTSNHHAASNPPYDPSVIHLNAPKLQGRVAELLEVFFEERIDRRAVATVAAPLRSTAPPPPQAAPERESAPFRFSGRKLSARVIYDGPRAALSDLSIEGDVVFEGRDMRLAGPNLAVDGAANRLRIDGPGRMELPFLEFSEGRPNAPPGVLTLDWRRRMDFDGVAVQFESAVAGAVLHEESGSNVVELRAETLKAVLQSPIRFLEADAGQKPKVEKILASGGAAVTCRAMDLRQETVAVHRAELTDFIYNRLSGEFNGGPGWINSVQAESETLPAEPNVAPGPGSAAASPARDRLKCLRVWFPKSIAGNLSIAGNPSRRYVVFEDRVEAARASVNDWNALLETANPDRLGPDGMALKCDRLTVTQQLDPLGRRRTIGMEALGNAVVEGAADAASPNARYTARGHRISYDQGKELLILEGDGRNKAELWREMQIGAERLYTAALKISYWLKTKQVNVDGVQSMQIGRAPNENAR